MHDINETELVKFMVDKTSVFTYKLAEKDENAALKANCLSVTALSTSILNGVSFDVKQGELLGIGGLQGQGQRDLLLALFGDIPFTGEVIYLDQKVHFTHARHAMKQGMALVPGDRAREGLLYIRSILENLLLPSWHHYGLPLKIEKSKQHAQRMSDSLNLKMAGLQEPVSSLSGGNAQKVVIGKWLMRSPSLLLLDDPTKGVDVNTKAEFYGLLTKLCSEGKTILFYSSDDEELIGLCDRVLVLYDGKIRSELKGNQLTKENLVSSSLGIANEVSA